MKKIAQIGTFDVENYGDLLFPDVLSCQFKGYSIDLFSPNGGLKPFNKNVEVFPLNMLEQKCLTDKYDALIVGGGDLIRLDNRVSWTYKESIESSFSLWQLPLIVGNKYDIPVIFNSPGVPYEFADNQKRVISEIFKQSSYISVRDAESKNILNSCKVKNVKVVPDTIFVVDDVYKKLKLNKVFNNLKKDKKFPNVDNYVIFQHNKSNIDNEKYVEEICKFLNYVIKNYGYNILLMPIGYIHDDIDFLKKIYSKICKSANNNCLHLIEGKLSPEEMLSVVSNSCGYVGTSMHGAITSYAYHRPLLMINVKRLVKVEGFLNLLKLKKNQVGDIRDLKSAFDKYFITTSYDTHKMIKSKIYKHFSTIKKLLKNRDKESYSVKNLLTNVMVSAFEELPNSEVTKFYKANIYFDFGNGFNEAEKKETVLNIKNSHLTLKCNIPKQVKSLRVDLVEDAFFKYSNLKVKIDDNYVCYIVPDSIKLNDGWIFVNSIDPKIIIDNVKPGNLEMYGKFTIVDHSKISDIIDDINKQLIYNENMLKVVNKKFKRTMYYYVDKIGHKLLKKQ